MKKTILIAIIMILLSACADKPNSQVSSQTGMSKPTTESSVGEIIATSSSSEACIQASKKYDFSQVEEFANYNDDFLNLSKEFEKVAEFGERNRTELSGNISRDRNHPFSVKGTKKIKEIQETVKYIFDNSDFVSISFSYDDRISCSYFVMGKGSKGLIYYFDEPNDIGPFHRKITSQWYSFGPSDLIR